MLFVADADGSRWRRAFRRRACASWRRACPAICARCRRFSLALRFRRPALVDFDVRAEQRANADVFGVEPLGVAFCLIGLASLVCAARALGVAVLCDLSFQSLL